VEVHRKGQCTIAATCAVKRLETSPQPLDLSRKERRILTELCHEFLGQLVRHRKARYCLTLSDAPFRGCDSKPSSISGWGA